MPDSRDKLINLLNYAKKAGADAADALSIATTDISASCRLGRPEGIERSENAAIGLRVFIGNRQAMTSSTDLTPAALESLAERAVSMARTSPPDPDSTLAPTDRLSQSPPELALHDDEEPSVAWLMDQVRIAEASAMECAGITNSEGADAGYSQNRIELAALYPDGTTFLQGYQSSYHSLSVSVLAGEGTAMERDYDFTSARHRRNLKEPQLIGREAARRALQRLNPRKALTSQVPIVFDPRVSRSLMSILCGAINGAQVARSATFLKEKMGQRIFSPGISIWDDPHLPEGLGSKPFDGEGVQNRKLACIEDGTLTSWLLDVRSANKLKLAPTGHAARSLSSPPSPAPSNFYMSKGNLTPAELRSDIRQGFYVTETFGMGVNIVTGDYSQGASGFWIENGELAYPISEVTIAGQLSEMFAQLTPANDLEFRYSINAPSLRIDRMTVAGK